MRSKNFGVRRAALLTACMLPGLALPLSAQPSIRGSIAGKVFDKSTGKPISRVAIRARAITLNQSLSPVETDLQGRFSITDAPTSVYAFTLSYRGADYRVVERLDARTGMSFLLESCFELDATHRSASVSRATCSAGVVEEAKVATLSPHRFMRAPDSVPRPDSNSKTGETPVTPEITHHPLFCLPVGEFPLVRADIRPREQVQVVRVYFRSSQHPSFYYVEMKLTERGFEAVLPKPLPETKQVIYYIEALSKWLDNARTEDAGPQVSDEEECKRKNPGGTFPGEPGIVVGATQAGAAGIPPGFMATGITGFVSAAGALSGGASTTGLVVIIGGAAAGATGVVITIADEPEASPPGTKK